MIRREQQRFSLRKYKVGVASVFLGTTLSFLMANGSAVKASEIVAQRNPGENTELIDKNQSKESAADVENTVVTESSEATLEPSTPEVKPEEAKSESTEAKSEETKAEKTEEKPSASSEAKSESSKPVASEPKIVETVVAKPKAEEKIESKPEEKSEPKAELSAVTEASSLDTTVSAANVEAKPLVDKATLALAAENTVNAGALATNGGRRRRRAATDHNAAPIDVLTTLADNVAANPDMTDPNGASVHSQTIPAGYQAKEGDFYTFGIWDLTRFNARYNTNYYARAYKTFGTSTDTTVELIDKNTGNVVETHTVTATSGVQKFTTTTPKSNNELTLQVDYQAGAGQGPGKTDQPFIQMGFEVGPEIQALVAPGHTLTPAEQARFNAVYEARNSHDILNAVEPAYKGREVTDTNFKIPVTVDKTTYYKVVDQANPTYKETGKSVTTQDYKENGNETSLATYTLKAMEGQNFTASGERQFTKIEELTDKITRETAYKLYQTAGPDTTSGYVSRPYTVGTRFMDAERAGIKRIKEIVDEDGSVVIRVYLLDPKQQSKRSDGTLNTDGYMLLAETKPIKPGKVNTEDLVVQKTPLYTIPFTTTDGVNYPNGKEMEFGFQKAAGYIPKKTVFVPFLGDNIGHLSPNEQLERGNFGIGTNVDLLNGLTPYKQPIYYYDKSETIKVKPEVEKQLEGRALVDGEFSFKIKENSSSPGVEETVTNKDGKATFSELSFTKEGTYTYTITEAKGADKDVDYDAMEVTMTVKVTKDAHGDLQAEVKYSGTGGFASSADDKVFNNYVVAPVKTKFDFSKALAGRELKAGEFSFVLKDSTGNVLQTKTNTKEGVVAFDDLTFDNTQVGTHKYTVEEVQGSEAGMTYDPMKAEVTITVTKEGHLLKATNTLPADREFNNTFTPAPVKVNLEFDKSLSNGTLNAGDFSFSLTGDNNVSETVTNKANGKINFSELSFDQAGVYNYTVKEVKGNKADVDYDAMTIAVKVTVTKDAATGLLSAKTEMTSKGGEATGTDDKVFNNHVVAPVTARFDFSKALAGRKLKAGEFSFVLKNSEGTVLQTKQNDADGKVKFDALTFTNTQVGNHKYTVEEVIPETKEAGMTYDTMKANVTVSVTKSGHALTAVATLPQDKEFNNTFTPTATQAQFKFTKRLEGKELTKDAFTFELLENGNVIQTKKNASDGTIQFDAIAYDQEGTHTYTVREVAGADTNIDYDSMNAVVTVNVTKDAATGLLSAKVNMPEDTEFNNYVVAPVVTKFDFTKKLAGRALQAGEFSFVLKDSTGKTLQTKTNTKEGVVAFDDLTFDNTQVGTHKYTVEEVQGSEAGMTYDPMKAEVTITVTKEGHVLKATNTLPADTEFNNTFTPSPVKVNLEFDKSLSNGNLNAGDFSFTLTGDNNVNETVTNKANGKINFSELSFDQVGVYNYTVKEIKGDKADVDYDAMTIAVKVTVTKDASTGLLSAKTAMTSTGGEATGEDDKVFNNHVVAPVTAQFDFSKALAGRTLKAGEFSFVLKDKDGTVIQTKQNDAAGKVKFDALTFTNAQVGDHKYTVEEVIPETKEAGMTYDTMKANVTVTVTKSGHALTAVATLPQDKEFNNTVTPAATNAQFRFTKRLEGKTLEANAFTFELLENGNVIQTKQNAADGSIQFDAIPYAAVGTHTYTVREKAGTDTNIDYDNMNAVVTVNVTKDAQTGLLNAAVTMPEDTEFNNYAVAPVTAQFDFSKALAGRKLKDGEFSFVLKDAEGNTLQTKTNDADGKVKFDALTFTNTQVGVHKYTVEEVAGSEAGMEYDPMKAEVTITVTKSGHALTATKALPTDTEFNNTFTPAATNAQFRFTKKLEGKELTKDAFTFELLENGNVIQTKKNAADGSITFDAIEYNAVGEHTYTVREVAGTDTNIDYDSMNAVVTVNVTKDAASGILTANVTMPEDTEFNNYHVAPVVARFDFTKKLAGRKLAAGEFSFVLKDSTGKEVETVKNDEDGNVTFSELSFDNTKVGTHTYTVEEVIPENKEYGMTYDQMKATVTVEVAKNGHTLTTVTNVTSTGGKNADGSATDGTADKEFNNKVTPPETPEFQPEKFVVSKEKYDITGNKLMDDDDELSNEYTETNADPYVDKTTNNELENLNTKTVKRGSKLVYQVWLDTTKFTEANNIQYVGVSDTYDAEKLDVNAADIKAYDSVTGDDVTAKFDIKVENGTITATSKEEFIKDKVNAPVIDTTKFAFGRYYKFDIPATVKESVKAGADIENTANQTVHVYNPVSKTVEKPEKPTQKRVNSVPVPVEMNFTKRLEGRELQENEFEFVLKKDGVEVERVKNDAAGKIVFKTLEFGRDDLGKTYNYTVEETPGTDATVTYDTMVATVKVVVSHDGTAKAIVANVTDAADKEFNNSVTPPEEPKFQPEKYVVSEEKFDITGDKLVDDDKELTDKYADTNANPYADDATNNETQNINTKTVERGSKLVYQVWLDTTKFSATNKENVQSVGITDDFDETKLDLDETKIKAYDSVTGDDVTAKFDITVNNGVITATLKDGFTKSLGDAENTQVIDTTKFAFGRYYKFDIPTTVKADVVAGADIENTAAQVVNYYNPTTKKVEKPSKPTEKRVNSVPVPLDLKFTKSLEGRQLQDQEFTFVLKKDGNVVETVKNDATGKITFKTLEFGKDDIGKTYNYTVEEVAGTDATVKYDTMVATVKVVVSHDGTAKAIVANVTDAADKEFNNRVTPPEEPKFQPEKYVVSEEKYDITGDKLVDDDKELADKYADTNANPYADDATNNEAQNLNTKTVKRGDKLVYQVWLDTTKFDAANKDNIQSVGISDDYDETKLDLDSTKIKAYDSVTGDDVTAKFDITVNNGVITATLKDGFTKSLGDAENTQVIDTTKFAFGRYYKFDIPTTVKESVKAGADIENTAAQVVNYYNPTTKKVEKPSKPTEKRVNSVPVPLDLKFTKSLEGRQLQDQEFTFVLKKDGNVVETVKNDATGKITFKTLEFGKDDLGKTYNYTVEETPGTDATVTYDTMVATVKVVVSHDGTAKAIVTNVTDAADKEFNNVVTPPEEPKFQPEKYVVSEEKFDITGDKLVDDDKELADKYADTNANPYADDASNNEEQNLNTKTVKRGAKLVYQVWLDTTKFDAANKDNIQSVGISDDYDEAKLDLDSTKIKAYDSVTGDDVTDKFDIAVDNGVITATLKAGFTKSLGDAENTQIIDTTKFAFGRYYKFDIPATVKTDVAAGADIENTAAQVVNYYNPTTKKVEKPEKPTEKRVNSVPISVDFNFTKKLEGRELKAGEFSFVLKDAKGKEIETVQNDKDGKVKFAKLEFTKAQVGTHKYTVEEVKGSDATVTYDSMKAEITVEVKYDGTAKALVKTLTDAPDKEFNNVVTPPEEPKFQPEKYVVSEEKFDITGDKLVDDDSELTDKYGETNTNPYADGTSNNESQNLNTKTVKRGDKLVYQVWLDTTQFDAANKDNIQSVGISDDYDETKLDLDATKIKAYDSVTGDDVTAKLDIVVNNGVITATLKAGFTKSLGDAENTQIIDTTKFAFGRYYKFDIPATVKADVAAGADIENTAAQVVNYYNPTTKKVEKPEKPTEKRVNSVPISVDFNFTKKLEGRELKVGEFSFVLKAEDGTPIETVQNDKDGNVKFKAIEYKKGQEGTYKYTIEEVKGSDATVTYDSMKAEVTVVVEHNGKAKALVKTVTDAPDKEFNNVVTPPEEPKFQPEKYVVTEEKFDITGDKLLDDDSELADKYGDTNKDPYADKTDNNEAQNLNTKTVKPGAKLVYQVWLDTTKFDAANKDNIQTVSISDDFDEAKVDVDASAIKAYDSVTGADVTDKFDIKVENGVITATLKAGFTKSLGDAENTQIIDTTKFAFGRYYKFDIPATVKTDVVAGADIENTAAQIVHYYNPTSKTVEKPEKPTEKRVNSVPISVDFNFTKKLEGRELKAGEFSFVLKAEDGTPIETVQNDKDGNVKFKAIEYKKGQEGTYKYTIEEVKGTDATVTYDSMKDEVTVVVEHNGKAKALVKTVTDAPDKEFNNVVTPPEEPKFQPEKYVVSEEKFDITGDKLVDDDKELADKVADTNANPYADDASNNEAQNLNTKTVKPGAKLVYQVWLDTTKFDAANKDNIQSVSISDDFDETKVNVDASAIKAYDSVTGTDVTDKFDIKVENGVMTATLKAGFTKSLGDAENTQVIDTTKFAFGRYYKFDIPTKVKADVAAGSDIENTAAQVVNYYNPTTKKVEKPEKPTEKRVNSVPISVDFNFTKKLEGRELKVGEFSFVLKAEDGTPIETVQNDKDGNVKFKAIEYKKGQEGTYKYTIEEVKGYDATVTYDSMKAEVTVVVEHNGKAKALVKTVTDAPDKEFNNVVTPPEEPKFQPEKYVVTEEKFDITGDKLLDDDSELTDKYGETNTNPYVDGTSNNEAQNLNTKTVKPGAKLVYQVWLDTTKFDAANKDNIQTVSISDDFDETKVNVDASAIKAYDSVTGADVTDKFDIKIENGVMTATLKAGFTKSLGDAENTQIIDTTKFAFGRYYKFDIPATVKADVAAGADIENTAAQVVNYYNPTTKKVEKPEKPTEKRVNSVPISVDFNFTKKLEGRELKAGEFSFVLKAEDGTPIETVQNDKDGNVKFKAIEYKKEQAGVHNYTVEEVAGTDATVTYDAMKAVVTVEVKHDGTAKALITNVTDPADKEFNNTVRPPEIPEFNPEKYILNESKFDLTGVKLLDDDSELKDKVADTNANPYADGTTNNEVQNINTKTLKKGDKVYYQVWLDTTKFTEAHNIQSVGVTDKYDSANLNVNGADIKAYDSVTGEDVTAKFDIKVENGVITATSKADLTKSLGDAENTQVIDTTKLAFGRYYKFEIPAEIKQSAQEGVDIENTASQIVHQYDPTKKSVEKPEKPTEKRVINIPVKVQFQFTKKLEGRELKAGEFSFVLKDEKGNVIETVTNDAAGKIQFSALEFKRGEEGTHLYHVEEIRGTDSSVVYDKMVATVGIVVKKDGKVLVATTQLPEDTEFNNKVTPPTPPTPPTPEKPKGRELPNTGEKSTAGVAALGAALGLAGLGLVVKRKKEDEA